MAFKNHLPNHAFVSLIYGCGIRIGKTSIVKELINNIESDNIIIISGTYDDWLGYTVFSDYDIEFINAWLRSSKRRKILVLDDFLHIDLAHGRIAKHFASIIANCRHENYNCNVIISTHMLNQGKSMKVLPSVFMFLSINEDSEHIISSYMPEYKTLLPRIKQILHKKKFSFLMLTRFGEWRIMKLNINSQ